MNNKIELKGKCLCGAVKYKLTEKPLFTQACHCKDCKILTGSSYVINSSVLDNTLSIEGEISSTIKLQAGSGKSVKIFFCNKCGSYIYTDYESAIGRLNVRTKTLEKSDEFPPKAHIFTKDKDEWVNLSNINNCFEKMYDPKETWPKESIIRIKEYLNTKK
jgi:hypothetical protein